MKASEASVTEALHAWQEAQEAADRAKERLDETIREAFSGGATGPEIARWTGLSRPRIYQIRDHTR